MVKDYMIRANEAKRINFKFSNIRTVLHKLHLIKENKLLKAAEVLFCDDNSMEVQAAVFAGIDKLTFLDIKQFKGNIFSLKAQSEIYIKEHMNWRADLKGSRREEIPEIPIRAIIEAIVNSLCHRDYANPKGNEIAIFKDRIEIYNPGQFPEEATPEDFINGKEHSILRNPWIAETLYKSSDIEKWGSGLNRICEECNSNNVKVKFECIKTGFVVVFYRPAGEYEEKLDVKMGHKDTSKDTVKVTEKVTVKVTENQEKILEEIRGNQYVTTKKLSEIIGISERKIKENIKKLKEKRLLKRIGPDKGGYWKISVY
jgi:ATP-dependent DNA helicase RecG